MSIEILHEIIEKVDLLTNEERIGLLAELAKKVRTDAVRGTEAPLKWSDLKGMLAHPACGEDAQAYISRSRREAEDKRSCDSGR
jgi:hypothetical protein